MEAELTIEEELVPVLNAGSSEAGPVGPTSARCSKMEYREG